MVCDSDSDVLLSEIAIDNAVCSTCSNLTDREVGTLSSVEFEVFFVKKEKNILKTKSK